MKLEPKGHAGSTLMPLILETTPALLLNRGTFSHRVERSCNSQDQASYRQGSEAIEFFKIKNYYFSCYRDQRNFKNDFNSNDLMNEIGLYRFE